MSFKNEGGYTGIDIAISVVVLFILVSAIAMLSYGFNSSAKEIEKKAEATRIAVEEIEEIKNTVSFEEVDNLNTQTQETDTTGFFRTIVIEDYADLHENKVPGLVKKITVKIQYNFKAKEQTVELSTIVSKEN